MLKIKIYSFFVLLVITTNLNSFISYTVLANQSGQKILFLGDMHSWPVQEWSQFYAQRIAYFLETLQGNKLRKSIPLFLEVDTLVPRKDEAFPATYQNIINSSSKLSHSVQLLPCDPRGKESTLYNTVIRYVYDHFSKQIGMVKSAGQDISIHPREWELLLSNIRTAPLTLNEYFEIVEKSQAKICEICQSYPSDSTEHKIFNNLYEPYLEACKEARELLNEYLSCDFYHGMIQWFSNCKTIGQFIKSYDRIVKLVGFRLEYQRANSIFLESLLKALDQGKTHTILIAGEVHVIELIKAFRELGYVPLKSDSAFGKVFDDGTFMADLSKLQNLLPPMSNALNLFLMDGAACNVCFKQNDLKACGKCKIAKYCCQKCQKDDWSEHKKLSSQCATK